MAGFADPGRERRTIYGNLSVLGGEFDDEFALLDALDDLTIMGDWLSVIGGDGADASASIEVNGTLDVSLMGSLEIHGGDGDRAAARIVADRLNVEAGTLDQVGGGGLEAEARQQGTSGLTLIVDGDARTVAGSGIKADAEIISRSGLQTVYVGGTMTVTGGGGFEANAGFGAEGGGDLDLTVDGDLILTGGTGEETTAGAGSSGGDVRLTVGGDLIAAGSGIQGVRRDPRRGAGHPEDRPERGR